MVIVRVSFDERNVVTSTHSLKHLAGVFGNVIVNRFSSVFYDEDEMIVHQEH